MKKLYIIIVICFCVSGLKAQSLFLDADSLRVDSNQLNQYDNHGKKTGYWTIFLNEDFKTIKTIDKARYYFYAYYQKGVILQDYRIKHPVFGKHKIYGKGINEDVLVLLDGDYLVYNNKSKGDELIKKFQFNKGLLEHIVFFNSFGKKDHSVDYTVAYNGNKMSHLMILYDENNSVNKNIYSYYENESWHTVVNDFDCEIKLVKFSESSKKDTLKKVAYLNLNHDFGKKCSEEEAIEIIKKEGCKLEADYINIVFENKVSGKKSCYQFKVEFYKYVSKINTSNSEISEVRITKAPQQKINYKNILIAGLAPLCTLIFIAITL